VVWFDPACGKKLPSRTRSSDALPPSFLDFHDKLLAGASAGGGTRQQADDPSNLWSACGLCHAIKTERERSEASAAANRKRAALRRKRLRRPEEKHPGDD
jgi:hypothetical protein